MPKEEGNSHHQSKGFNSQNMAGSAIVGMWVKLLYYLTVVPHSRRSNQEFELGGHRWSYWTSLLPGSHTMRSTFPWLWAVNGVPFTLMQQLLIYTYKSSKASDYILRKVDQASYVATHKLYKHVRNYTRISKMDSCYYWHVNKQYVSCCHGYASGHYTGLQPT